MTNFTTSWKSKRSRIRSKRKAAFSEDMIRWDKMIELKWEMLKTIMKTLSKFNWKTIKLMNLMPSTWIKIWEMVTKEKWYWIARSIIHMKTWRTSSIYLIKIPKISKTIRILMLKWIIKRMIQISMSILTINNNSIKLKAIQRLMKKKSHSIKQLKIIIMSRIITKTKTLPSKNRIIM